MPSLLSRLRGVLPPPYVVERLLASGGMAHVFAGRDRRLDRPVAIKVLRPELATARGAERFLREARTLASLSHPNLLPVYDVGEAGGLRYMILALADGPTLRDRLEAGPLEAREVARLGRDLLDALAAVHARGVVHRDVKPSNVFLVGGRALLGDFGVAVGDDPGVEPLTRTGERVGTPAYRAPEVAAGGPATPRSDLYAVGMVLYEAATARRWSSLDDPTDEALVDVPPPLRPALRRTLARRPEDRWEGAAELGEALADPGARRRLLPVAAIAVALVVGGVGAWLVTGGGVAGGADSPVAPSDLVLLPCETVPAADSLLGLDVVRLATLDLQGLPDLRVARAQTTFAWWEAIRNAGAGREDPVARVHDSRYAARCTLLRRNGSLEARIELQDDHGSTVAARVVRGPATDPPVSLGDSVAVALLRALEDAGLPSAVLSGRGSDALSGRPFPAIRAFLRGEEAFQRSDWRVAEKHYGDALRIDPAFSLAEWRLVDVSRWQLHAVGLDLGRLHREGRDRLGPLDRRLLEARLMPAGPDQLARYREVLGDYPNDAYAALLYGDELLHRGPLAEVVLDSAMSVLRRSAVRDSFFSPVLEHLAQAEIRLDREADARRSLDRLHRLVASRGGADGVSMVVMLEQAWRERFRPEEAAAGRASLLSGAGSAEATFLATYGRWAGPYLDLPEAVLAFGRRLTEVSSQAGRRPVEGLVTTGLALFSLGRTVEALAHFDSAAAASDREAGRLQAAEWRVLPAALGLVGVSASEVERGRDALARIAEDGGGAPLRRLRAASALALLAHRTGDAAGVERWTRLVGQLPDSTAGLDRQARLLDAVDRARAGDPGAALRISGPLLAADSAGHLHRPFERAAVALLRGEWHAAAGDPRAAEASWRWHENSDLELPTDEVGGLAQAGEVDWALGTEPRIRAASAALSDGRPKVACRLARETVRHLAGADPPFRPVQEEARALARAACAA